MKRIKADPERRIALEGVTGTVPRPVDIDQTLTGFDGLRTLRIYRFDPPAVIDGHAEEDEVFIVVLSGSVDLIMRSGKWHANGVRHRLSAADAGSPVDCAAYLPPQTDYRLTPQSAADIAYVRATPTQVRAPAILTSAPHEHETGVRLLLEDSRHAERLRIRLLQINAAQRSITVQPTGDAGDALLHVRTTPVHNAARIDSADTGSTTLDSWDTVIVPRGARPTLHVAAGSSALAFTASVA